MTINISKEDKELLKDYTLQLKKLNVFTPEFDEIFQKKMELVEKLTPPKNYSNTMELYHARSYLFNFINIREELTEEGLL